MITYADVDSKYEFEHKLHPACRAIVLELDRWLCAKGWPPIVVTDVSRDDAAMARIYGKDWKKDGRFSWHLSDRAIDVRSKVWSPFQQREILKWLRLNWPGCEVILHDVGRGHHLHIAVPKPWSMLRRLRRALTVRRERKLGRIPKE